jgi:hypothetical protein
VVSRSEAATMWSDWERVSTTPVAVAAATRAAPSAPRALALAGRCAERGHLARADRLARFAYGHLRRQGCDVRQAVFLLGQIALARGHLADAGPWFHGALAASDRSRSADRLDIEALLWLALAAFLQGDRALAETRLTAACRWAGQSDAPELSQARCRGFLGWMMSRGSELKTGVDHLEQAAQTFRRHRRTAEATAFDALCAAAEARSGQTARAHRRLASARVTTSVSVQPLLDLAEAIVELREARWAFEHAELARAQRLAQSARARGEAALDARLAGPPERWIQRRVLGAALADLEGPLAAGSRAGPVIEVAHDGAWFRTLDADTVGCERRPVLRRLLVELSRQRIEHPGRPIPGAELFAAGWPDQRISVASAKNRLKVAISTLRKMGFGPAIVGDRSGYRIDPRVSVRLVDAAR